MTTAAVASRPFTLMLLTSLYLAQGLPFGFFTQALPVLMRERGLSLTMIGFSGVLFLPWALKFLWAPWVDGTGTRRGWILSLQLLTLAGAVALAFVDLGRALWLVFGALVFFNLLAATQDIATDGLAVRLLGPADRGLGNGIQVGAYRFGMILGGGALLWIFARAGWPAMFLSMAAILLLTCVPAFFLREVTADSAMRRQPARALMSGWLVRLRQPGMVGFMALICACKFGESATSSLVGPFMHDAGIGTDVIAIVKGGIGSVMGLLGAAVGGVLAFRAGRRNALMFCGAAQTLGMLGYIACAIDPSSHWLIYGASALEHGLGSMATVALFTLMMDAADVEHAGTDYTLFACAIVIGTGVAGIAIGLVGDALGYVAAFVIAAALSGAGCTLMIRGIDRGIGPARLAAVWPRTRAVV